MTMNLNSEFFRKAAESEAESCISVGGYLLWPEIIYTNSPFPYKPQVIGANSIVLAGPTLRTPGTGWRNEAIRSLVDLGFSGKIIVPERHDGATLPPDKHKEQCEWEWSYLQQAGTIVFWVCRNMETLPGLTTNIEFGYWMAKAPQKLVIGWPEDAEHVRYMELLWDSVTTVSDIPRYPVAHNLQSLMEMAVQHNRVNANVTKTIQKFLRPGN